MSLGWVFLLLYARMVGIPPALCPDGGYILPTMLPGWVYPPYYATRVGIPRYMPPSCVSLLGTPPAVHARYTHCSATSKVFSRPETRRFVRDINS